VEALFHDALDLPESEREAFLDRTCPRGDPLRAEIDSLLEADSSARALLQNPPARLAADLLDKHVSLSPGQRVQHYQIESLVTMGGRGEVYRARDTYLSRPVALKILRRHLTANETAVHRFEIEAQTASALSHPNIVAMYEFGNSPHGLYIAMEWIEGVT